MMQNYTIPSKLAARLAKKEWRMLKNSLRLWFWCKIHGYNSFYLNDLRPDLLQAFSYRSINIYLDYLVRHGWIGRDPYGKVFLRGRKRLFQVCGASSRMLGISVCDEHVKNLKAWSAFLAGAQVCLVSRAMRNLTPRMLQVAASTPLSGGKARSQATEHPISCKNLVQSLQISVATASRLRTRAQGYGLISNRLAFESTPFTAGSKQALLLLRTRIKEALPSYEDQRKSYFDIPVWSVNEFGKPLPPAQPINADALIRHGSQVWLQRPNMVSNLGISFRGISIGRKYH